MSSSSATSTAPNSGRGRLFLRLAVLAVLVASGFFLLRFTPIGELFDKERMIALLDGVKGEPWAPFALFGLFCLVAVFGLPVSPVLVGGGVVFGQILGTVYNFIGLLLSAMAAYFVGKALGREALLQLTGPKLRRAEKIFERRGFWPLVQTRFLPIPFSIVSYGVALAGVSPGRFFITSAIGLLPSTIVHTWYAPAILMAALEGEKFLRLTIEYGAAIVLLNVLTSLPQIRERLRRRERYRELMELRSSRSPKA